MTTKRAPKKSQGHSKKAKAFLDDLIAEPFTLGLLLRSLRLAEEETLEEFAGRLAISRSHLLDIEKGRKAVSPARASQFAEALGHSKKQFIELAIQDLLEREGVPGKVTVDVA
jgi:transcriptional regulator with XRE-family HTH domain